MEDVNSFVLLTNENNKYGDVEFKEGLNENLNFVHPLNTIYFSKLKDIGTLARDNNLPLPYWIWNISIPDGVIIEDFSCDNNYYDMDVYKCLKKASSIMLWGKIKIEDLKLFKDEIPDYSKNPGGTSSKNKKLKRKEELSYKYQKEFQSNIISQNSMFIKYITNPYNKLKLKALDIDSRNITYIKNPSEQMCLKVITENKRSRDWRGPIAIGIAFHGEVPIISYIENPSEKIKIAAINQNPISVAYIKQNDKIHKLIIEKDPRLLRYLINPSEEIKLQAVNQNGLVISHINNPSEEVKLAAVRQTGNALYYIRYRASEEIQLEAVNQNGLVISHINNPNEDIQIMAIRSNYDAIRFIQNPTEYAIDFAKRLQQLDIMNKKFEQSVGLENKRCISEC